MLANTAAEPSSATIHLTRAPSVLKYYSDDESGVAVGEGTHNSQYDLNDELSQRLAHFTEEDSQVGPAPTHNSGTGPMNSFNYWKNPPSNVERLPKKVTKQARPVRNLPATRHMLANPPLLEDVLTCSRSGSVRGRITLCKRAPASRQRLIVLCLFAGIHRHHRSDGGKECERCHHEEHQEQPKQRDEHRHEQVARQPHRRRHRLWPKRCTRAHLPLCSAHRVHLTKRLCCAHNVASRP